MHIRPAQPDDAAVAATLLYSAYMHTQVAAPLPNEPLNEMVERLRHHVRQDDNPFSYLNIQVAEERSGVIGLVLSFADEMKDVLMLPWGIGSNMRQRTTNGISIK